MWRLIVRVRGLGSSQARSLPDLQVAAMWYVLFLQVHYARPNEVVGYNVACQVGKAYNICPPASWSFLKGLDTIMRSRPFFKFELVFLGNRGVINATCVVWGPQRPCHYVVCVPGPVFSVPNATIASD